MTCEGLGLWPTEALVRALLPHGIEVAILHLDHGPEPSLLPEEKRLLSPTASPRRRREFALGRGCARAALTRLDMEPVAIGRGAFGRPIWPRDIVGAITHRGDSAAAIVGRSSEWAGIGIDLEHHRRAVAPGAAELICSPAEHRWVNEAPDQAGRHSRVIMLFSAKESLFKAMSAAYDVRPDFGQLEMVWDSRVTGFRTSITGPLATLWQQSALLVPCRASACQVLTCTWIAR